VLQENVPKTSRRSEITLNIRLMHDSEIILRLLQEYDVFACLKARDSQRLPILEQKPVVN
jgi:hypothetical protein